MPANLRRQPGKTPAGQHLCADRKRGASHGSNTPDHDKIAETAGYIAQLCAEMAEMASQMRLNTLGYFLAMAQLEAEMAARSAVLQGRR